MLGGHALLANNSRWLSFGTLRCGSWRDGNIVLLGDAAHTAHFSIGSGTKLAMEDALALAACLHENDTVPAALAAYEAERRPVVASTQRAAQASLEWFENLGQYAGQEPEQFAFNIMTRSRRVTHANLRLRDPEFTDADGHAGSPGTRKRRGMGPGEVVPPMFQPFRLRELELPNRVVVSAMDMYSAADGMPSDFHLVHLGGKALGGAGLVMTEMVCVSPEGRITPGCAGLYTAEHEDGLAADHLVRARSVRREDRASARALRPQGLDQADVGRHGPAAFGGNVAGLRPVTAAVYAGHEPGPARADGGRRCKQITGQFVAAAQAADRAGFDLLELHCAHGYLLSSFISPVTNQRTDSFGGSLAGRLRYPLEVFAAIRAVWPEDKPMTVRISACDWVPGGITGADAVEIARAFAAAGADAIDVSTGQVIAGGEAGLRPVVPDPVRRRDQEPGRHRHHRGRRDLLLRRRELAHPGRPRRPVRARPGAPVRPELDPARGRRAGLRRARRALAGAVAARQPAAADRPHRRPAAAA